MTNAAAGTITFSQRLGRPSSHLIREKALHRPFARKRTGAAGKAVRRRWNGLETFDLFDVPGSSGTNDQIEEAE